MRTDLRTLPVGRLPYLNVLPFHAAWQGPEPRWRTAPPRRLGAWAAAGELAAACLASRDALALAETFRPLGHLGIACDGPVSSVLLFSRRPPEDLDGATIALTGESRTSRGLLRVLLAGYWRVRRPRFVEEAHSAEARLLIGDTALAAVEAQSRAAQPWLTVVDLGAAWKAWTGLPFVYARWVVGRGQSAPFREALEHGLEAALRRFSPATEAQRTYLQRFQYRLGAAEEAALERFHEELARHDLLEHHQNQDRRRSAA
jgi:chorismate dehydratase